MSLLRKLALVPLVTLLVFSSIFMAPNSPKVAAAGIKEYKNLSPVDVQEIIDGFNEYKVDKETQEALLEKLDDGKIWDSLDPNAEPVESHVQKFENGFSKKVDTYADGSVVATEVEIDYPEIAPQPSGNIRALATPTVSGGTVTSGSGYLTVTGAKVNYDAVVIKCFFYANYQLVQGAYDKISWVSPTAEAYIHIIGGTFSERQMSLPKSAENINGPAYATLSFIASASSIGTMACLLKLSVGNDKTTATTTM